MSEHKAEARPLVEAVSYALASPIRIEILTALNEQAYSVSELSKLLHYPVSTVGHHVEELLKSKSIEVAYTKQRRNFTQSFYRAVEIAYFTDEEVAAMSPDQRNELSALILQASMAEGLASLQAGKFRDDLRLFLAWRWFHVDDEGREAIADEQARHWARVGEIEAESNARCIESGEETRSIIVASHGFERCRAAPHSLNNLGTLGDQET